MESKNCFFILDSGDKEENEKMTVLCTDCYDKLNLKNGWFWEGSVQGYSPNLFECNNCKTIIHKPEE